MHLEDIIQVKRTIPIAENSYHSLLVGATNKENELKLFFSKNLILFLSIMTGFLFLSGAGIAPQFFVYTPSAEMSEFVITISVLVSFVLLGRKIVHLLFKSEWIRSWCFVMPKQALAPIRFFMVVKLTPLRWLLNLKSYLILYGLLFIRKMQSGGAVWITDDILSSQVSLSSFNLYGHLRFTCSVFRFYTLQASMNWVAINSKHYLWASGACSNKRQRAVERTGAKRGKRVVQTLQWLSGNPVKPGTQYWIRCPTG